MCVWKFTVWVIYPHFMKKKKKQTNLKTKLTLTLNQQVPKIIYMLAEKILIQWCKESTEIKESWKCL